jgi:hypothetical protein
MGTRRSERRSGGGAIFPGLVLILVGLWFLLRAFGVRVPGMDQLWPIFPVLAGLGFFLGFLFSPDKRSAYGLAIPGTITFLVGLLFFAFTLGYLEWGAMESLWPVFLIIVGASFVVAWIFSGLREWGLLIPGGIVGGVGVVALGFALGGQGAAWARVISRGWPVILIAIGLAVLFQGLAAGRSPSTSEEEEPPTEEYKVREE